LEEFDFPPFLYFEFIQPPVGTPSIGLGVVVAVAAAAAAAVVAVVVAAAVVAVVVGTRCTGRWVPGLLLASCTVVGTWGMSGRLDQGHGDHWAEMVRVGRVRRLVFLRRRGWVRWERARLGLKWNKRIKKEIQDNP